MAHGKNRNTNTNTNAFTHGYQDCLGPDVFQNVMSSKLSLSMVWNMLRQAYYFDDLLTQTNSSFKDHQPKFKMVLASLSTNEFLV
jgi:hypothetical protein